MIKSNSDDDSIMMTMIDNDDVFLNLNNYPNPIAAFNNIMGQYYDINRNPVVRENMNMNMNREIVSSIQPTKTKTITSEKNDALTLDLLLPKPKSSYYPYYMKEEEKARTRGVGAEILATVNEPNKKKGGFDIRNYLTRIYEREQHTRDRNIHSTTSSNKLTLADLQSTRQLQIRTFIKSESDDY
ncbi:MAG: hypothetical protein WBY22_05090 [Nitrososphaeraceae archaeon]